YSRDKLRYPSDLTDEEWALVEPLIPPGKRGGGKRIVVMCNVVGGLMYILSTGCHWRAIPKDLPPRSTLFDYLDLWSWDGTLERSGPSDLSGRAETERTRRLERRQVRQAQGPALAGRNPSLQRR